MRKQRIRLSEAALHKIIRKCVNEAVRQMPKNNLRRRIIRKRMNESSMQQNIVVDGEQISFNELRRIAKWYDGLQDEDFIVYDGDEEIPVSVGAYVDLDDPYKSEFSVNDNSPEDYIDYNFDYDTSLEELVSLYQEYGNKTDVNNAVSMYLRDSFR